MTRTATGLRVLILMFLAGPAAGQERLTLDAAVEATLARNASLAAARASAAEAAAAVGQARAAFFPRVSFTESWQRSNQPVFVFSSLLSARRFGAANFAIDALNRPEPIGFFRASAGIEQVVFDGGRARAASAAAAHRSDIASAATDATAAGLALAATQTFGRILTAQSALESAKAGLAAAQEDLARARRRRDAGVATEADVLALAVHAADLQQRLIQAEGDAAIARAELNRLMGTGMDNEFTAGEPAEAAAAGESNLAALLAEADAARPELKRAASAERLAEAQRRGARAALIPQVVAQALVDVNGTRFRERESGWLVGGEVRWSLSLGGGERAAIDAAAQSAARARAEAEDARAAVHVDVVSALRGVETARARVAAGRAAVDQARESQRIIRDRFDAGIASVNDVLRASSAVLDAEASRISALVDAAVSEARLRRALGRAP